jgi:hypothetical protein
MRRSKMKIQTDEPEQTVDLSGLEQAQAWYALAARSDNNQDQAKLCELYSQKDGFDWFLNSAISGDIYAMYALGKMYSSGIGVNENPTKAATWFTKASAAEISYAHYELAKIFQEGVGLDPDPEYAESLFKKALTSLQQQEKQRPDPHAEYILATLYEFGLGVEKSMDFAQHWRNRADTGREEEEVESLATDQLPDAGHDSSDEEADSTPVPEPGASEEDTLPLPEISEDALQADRDVPPSPDRDIFSNSAETPVEQIPNPTKTNKGPLTFSKKHVPKTRNPPQKKKPTAPYKQKPAKKQSKVDPVQNLDFFDMVIPSVFEFRFPDYFVCGNTFRSVWAIREYPTQTDQMAILRSLGEKSGVTLHVYNRPVSPPEEDKILKKADKRNHSKRYNAQNVIDRESAEVNMADVVTLVRKRLRNKETLMHCAVFIELIASSLENLNKLKLEAVSICGRSKLVYDKLWLRQKDGFLTVMPGGTNQFGSEFERVIPSSSVGNLYPFSYSGKTDPKGMYIGEDVDGTNVIIDFDARSASKTNGHIIILGNSGEGKTYTVHLIITNKRQQGKKLYTVDVENDYSEQTEGLGGCSLDMMGGKYFINALEPRLWTDNPIVSKTDEDSNDESIPSAFRQATRLSQHIAYLRDFFLSYKAFDTQQLDTLEILLEKLYKWHHITDNADFERLKPEDYPILSDLFKLANQEIEDYIDSGSQLYTKDILRSLTLGLRSICIGAESTFFNGFTNITNSDYINFSVKDMLGTNENLKNAMFLNIFSWMSHKFLTEGDTDLVLDEFHEFVKNKIAVDYTRSFMKRGRKRNSDVIVASQNVEDLLLPGIVEYTKPLFSIPTHSFLFNPGTNVDEKAFQQALNLPDSEWDLIKSPNKGHCLFRSGNERYHLHVIAPDYKRAVFGTKGGL